MNFLINQYKKVDLFDACPLAVKRAKDRMSGWQNLGYIEEAMMQDFRWHYQYSAIFMVYSIGYLDWTELVPFLQRAKEKLDQGIGRITRSSTPESFIFVIDNVLSADEMPVVWKGQRPRTIAALESIFTAAGLIIHKKSGPKPMPLPFMDLHIWALF